MAIQMESRVTQELEDKYKLTILELKVSMIEDEPSVFVTLREVANTEENERAKGLQSIKPVSVDVQLPSEGAVNEEK